MNTGEDYGERGAQAQELRPYGLMEEGGGSFHLPLKVMVVGTGR